MQLWRLKGDRQVVLSPAFSAPIIVFALPDQKASSSVRTTERPATWILLKVCPDQWPSNPFKLDDEWPESIFHHVGSQSVSYLLSVQCEVLSRVS